MSIANKRGPTMTPEVLTKMEELYFSTTPPPAAAAIHRRLRNEFGSAAPKSARAVQQRLKKLRPHDPSGKWVLPAPARGVVGVDPAAVLRVMGANIEQWGSLSGITNREAQWITVITAAAPDIPGDFAYHLARHYMLAEERGSSREGLDRMMALRVWKSREWYDEAVASGWVPRMWVSHFTVAEDYLSTDDEVVSTIARSPGPRGRKG